jgi:hypothetical protein
MKKKVETLIDAEGIEQAMKIDPETASAATTVTPSAAAEEAGARAAAEVPVLPDELLSPKEEGGEPPAPAQATPGDGDSGAPLDQRVEAKQ